jgi:hypothetical protein
MPGDPRTSPAVAAIIAARDAWRRTLLVKYKPTAERLQAAYARTLQRLAPYHTAVTDVLIARAKAGETITAQDVRGVPEWAQLLVQVELELDAFAKLADFEASQSADVAVTVGAKQAQALTVGTVPARAQGVINAAWIEPDPEAMRQLIGYVDGAAMQAKFAEFGAKAAQSYADVVLTGFAQGKHPVAMARVMANWLNVPYSWAQTTTRTAYLYSYRGANQATYAANAHILDGWMWWATFDGRTCLSCWDRHGRIYRLDAFLNDHHNGRCAPVPLVAGAVWPDEVLTGQQEFERLPDTQKREVLRSPQLWELYQAGKLPWGEFSTPYQNDVFGEMLRAATVKEILRAAG